MNLLHMKYAVAIAETNSINKAAETLYVGQSALSRAVKELESSLGVTIFERSAKGMFLTPDGEAFIRCAKMVLKQVAAIETMFSEGAAGKQRFSISVPRASYVADAFARFTARIDPASEIRLYYQETNALRAIKNILQEDYKLGIIRYAEEYDKYYKGMMDEKGLSYELIAEFHHVLLTRADSPLARMDFIPPDELKRHTEIAHADPYVPSLPFDEIKKDELPDDVARLVYVFERGSQFELLAQNPDAFMWVSPVPAEQLARYGLVQRRCGEGRRMYKDVLIHRRDYTLSALDSLFVEELIQSKRRTFQ